ncbi:pilus (MSHA type) biogenesis protein MshL [Paraferrimonas sedimenticola]|uniref:Pilus (MSHA type) biogenesis protein MshL n=1 Tax=Paraferrimonas sedimenticola TaxID=375674 RepID=A0AA37W257_9GAMM|nr:pilus (MSHA type) biogenesis protein MshL [Paraferrimonas sedimenticola]GLP97392.1 pilus (MSHA type) biogenesis protein MshL [Paraferrimonas sedimenticola]
MTTLYKSVAPIFALFLLGCQTTADRPQPTESKQALAQIQAEQAARVSKPVLPDALAQELSGLSPLAELSPSLQQERRFDVAANDLDARVLFPSLVKGTPLSVALHPNVSGTVTLSLKGVTLSEALTVIQDLYGYEVSLDGRILRVFPAGMRTETFPLNYLYMQRNGTSLTSINSGRISDQQNNNNRSGSNNSNNYNSGSNSGSNNQSGQNNQNRTNGTFIQSRTETNFWAELKTTLESIIGSTDDGRQVVVTPQAGLVTIRAYPNELRQVREFIKTAESHLQRQVILEAKVVEVTLNDGFQQGIHWEKIVASSGSAEFTFGNTQGELGDEITRAIGGITSLKFSGNDFAGMISLLDTQGDVDVLSSPRVTAANNQKAVIKVGVDEYFVTDVSSTTVTGTSPITTPSVELTPFFSGIALDVTPQIDNEGNVLLHVHPSVVDVKEQIKEIDVADSSLSLPLAQSEIRESDTVIKAASGDVVVIGGLMKTQAIELNSGVPVLRNIPVLGHLFNNKTKENRKTELVILLKPVVVGADTWKDELERSKQLLDRWYPEEG